MEGKVKKIVLLACGLIILLLVGFFYSKKSTAYYNSVTFFDVGQGDSALITFDNGEKMLVDCGINRKILSKLGSALPFFDRTIDYLLVTHPDGDHYGGCPAVLERYQVKNIITNGVQKSNDQFWLAWKKFLKLENAQSITINGGETMVVGGSPIKFLSPDESLGVEIKKYGGNNSSIVFVLKNNLGKFLFTGDMETPLENALLKKYCKDVARCQSLEADYLKVGHHGSDSSSEVDFLQAVSPEISIISVGSNKYGHPSLRTLRKLERAGSEIWRTDQLNDIIIK